MQGIAALSGGQHHHAAGVADGERGTHVLAEVQLLERHCVGSVRGEELLDRLMDIGQAPLLGSAGRRLDHAAVERHKAALPARDDAIAGVGQAGIYAEDDHAE